MRVRLSGLQPGQLYAVQLRSNNGEAVSDWSQRFILAADQDQTVPAMPTGFNVSNDETTAFKFTWNKVTTNTDGSSFVDFNHYDLYLRSGAGDEVVLTVFDNSYTLTQEENFNFLNPGSIYPAHVIHTKVRAVDNFGNVGAWTDEETSTNGNPPTVLSSDAVPLVDSIRFLWKPDDIPDDFDEYYVHMLKDNEGGSATFTPDDSNLIWHGRATSMVHWTTDYHHAHYFKVIVHDVFNNRSFDDSDKDVAHATPNDDGGGGGGSPRPPSGPAGGDLDGTYPNPRVVAIQTIDVSATPPTTGQILTATSSSTAEWDDPTGGGGGGAPSGPAGGDLTGTYPNPTIASGAVTDTKVASGNKDGLAATPSMRTLGTGAQQAAAGNDGRLSDSRTPNGSAGGDLGGTYPNPGVNKVKGITISGTAPTSGQVLTASSSSTAGWATPTGGSGGTGGIDIDCGGPADVGLDIDCGGVV